MSQDRMNKGSSLNLSTSGKGSIGNGRSIQQEQMRRLTLAEARRKASEDSAKAERSQLEYAEGEARRWFEYKEKENE